MIFSHACVPTSHFFTFGGSCEHAGRVCSSDVADKPHSEARRGESQRFGAHVAARATKTKQLTKHNTTERL